MSGHTPGPWNVMQSAPGRLLHVETDCDNPHGAGIAVCSLTASHAADAQLIAAAPELLEALRDMVSDHAALSPATLAYARAAIAKATA